MLSTPAKLNAPISKISSERLELTIQSFRIENKQLKENVIELQLELSKSSLKVSEHLDEDPTSIMAGAGQHDISPFMKFFWEEQQKYIKCSSRGIRYHTLVIQLCLSLAAKSESVFDDIQYDEKSGAGILFFPRRCLLRDYKNYIRPDRKVSTKIL